jgi:hypothetical protein
VGAHYIAVFVLCQQKTYNFLGIKIRRFWSLASSSKGACIFFANLSKSSCISQDLQIESRPLKLTLVLFTSSRADLSQAATYALLLLAWLTKLENKQSVCGFARHSPNQLAFTPGEYTHVRTFSL